MDEIIFVDKNGKEVMKLKDDKIIFIDDVEPEKKEEKDESSKS